MTNYGILEVQVVRNQSPSRPAWTDDFERIEDEELLIRGDCYCTRMSNLFNEELEPILVNVIDFFGISGKAARERCSHGGQEYEFFKKKKPNMTKAPAWTEDFERIEDEELLVEGDCYAMRCLDTTCLSSTWYSNEKPDLVNVLGYFGISGAEARKKCARQGTIYEFFKKRKPKLIFSEIFPIGLKCQV